MRHARPACPAGGEGGRGLIGAPGATHQRLEPGAGGLCESTVPLLSFRVMAAGCRDEGLGHGRREQSTARARRDRVAPPLPRGCVPRALACPPGLSSVLQCDQTELSGRLDGCLPACRGVLVASTPVAQAVKWGRGVPVAAYLPGRGETQKTPGGRPGPQPPHTEVWGALGLRPQAGFCVRHDVKPGAGMA